MRSFIILSVFCFISSFVTAQTAEEYYIKGIERFNNKDANGAIEFYNKALKIDPSHIDALFNRGVAKIAAEDFNGAIDDMNKTIKLSPNFTNAFYVRGAAKAYLNQYKHALEDMNQLINIDPEYGKAYTLRAQMKYALKDSSGACRDFSKGVAFGDREAEKFVSSYCSINPGKDESHAPLVEPKFYFPAFQLDNEKKERVSGH